MSRARWHISRDGARLTLARRLPLRFDLEAWLSLPDLRRERLAHQVRQDVWRALRDLRGFSPAVEVTRRDGGVVLRAGGRVDGPFLPCHEARLAACLADEKRQSRWVAQARRAA